MPNIPYPNVPPVPGVPGLNRAGPYVGAALTLAAEFLPLNLFGQEFAILKSNADIQNNGGVTYLLVPDSFVSFDYREDHKIPIYPMQDGAFQSYNKVSMPFEIKLTVTCSGNRTMSKEEFLNGIYAMINTTVLADIVTPDRTYKNTNLIHFDYRREAQRGATILICELTFQEVRIVTAESLSEDPSGAYLDAIGSLTPDNNPSSKLVSGVTDAFNSGSDAVTGFFA